MINCEINKRIRFDEQKCEIIISNVRLALGIIYLVSVLAVDLIMKMDGLNGLPGRAHVFSPLFFLFTLFTSYYVRKAKMLHVSYKYIIVVIDMLLIGGSIWVGCSYVKDVPPVVYLSIWALFYYVLILAGSFRYSVRCAYFSGIFAGISYLIVVIINRNAIDLPYSFEFEAETLPLRIPVYNEFFRVLGMVVTGWVTGMASKRRLALFSAMIESESVAAQAASKTVEQTRSMAKTIQKSTDDIFHSSKNIFSIANKQAASVQEIESTINENAQIAVEIAGKTGSVANIASKMEDDVNIGFSVLGQNVSQMEDIKQENDGVISGISALGSKIAKIGEIIAAINIITDQTKVIAFNAALEAASAGDRGKRFSVVASEVNRLADDIAALTKQIRVQIKEIQDSSSSLIVSGEKSAEKIAEGNNLIKKLEDIFREIRSGAEITANQAQTITVSTQKQQRSSEQINIAIEDISAGLSSFLRSTEVATSSAGELTRMIEELGAILNVDKEKEWQ